MTKQQYYKKCKELKKEMNKLFDNRVEKLLNSGAIELSNYDDNYILPKIVVCAIASEIQWQFKPLSKEGQKEVKNLELFV